MLSGSKALLMVQRTAPDSRKKIERAENYLRPALFKTRKNLALGEEIYRLTYDENKSLYRNHPFIKTHWIDADRIIYAANWSEIKAELIIYDGIGRFDLFASHVTSIFIRELIVQKIALEETSLYKSMSARRWVRPVILGGRRVKIPLNTHENMLAYLDKCQSLIKSIQANGVEASKHENIGLAITSEGIAHFRLGHHRLAIAQALGIKRIPIDIILISAQFLVDRVPRWRLWSNSAMVRAVNDVLSNTIDDFSKRCERLRDHPNAALE